MDSAATTQKIINKYNKWLSYWESKKDGGQSHAINNGFSLASGEIYCWLNSDDTFTNGSLKKIAMTFIKSNAQFVYGNSLNLKAVNSHHL
ncbi:glycosyltransferase involved in cell wall biosynthesis [Pedobacter sp. AK013]|nr:glycosyltransferase [Pedobacter sp. AK013]MBB6235499.1 glycosyltransferase involved in cell wall biosynthesis [Pedobacter sp. AK013]